MEESMKIKGLVTISIKRSNGSEELVCKDNPNLLTTAGRDWIHGQVYNSGTTDEAKYIGLSSDSATPDVGDVVLAGEIVGADLQRAAGTVTHSVGTNTTSIQHTFISAGSYTAVKKVALFTAITSGTMVHENSFTSVNLESGDQLTITWTITAG